MTPGAAAAFFAMSQAVTRDQAQQWAREAERRGATATELANAWAVWDQRETADVRPMHTCACERCWCGRPAHGVDGYCAEHDQTPAIATTRRFMDAEAYDPSPEPISHSEWRRPA